MTSFFEHQKLSFRKNYMRNLIQLASADGHLDESEVRVLFEIAARRNLKEWQLRELLEDKTPFEVFIPESFLNKMNLLFDLMKLIYADGIVDEAEIAYIRQILVAFKLSPAVMAELFILFRDGIPAADTWREFTESMMMEQRVEKFVTIL
jgi:uncharacterized tellurite resistance protein B-like protein